MKQFDARLVLAATDLSNFLACSRKTALDLSVTRGERERPHFDDPIVEILRNRGAEHEARSGETQRAQGVDIVDASTIEGVEQPNREARVVDRDTANAPRAWRTRAMRASSPPCARSSSSRQPSRTLTMGVRPAWFEARNRQGSAADAS